MDGTARFACSSCDSPSIIIPATLTDDAPVLCSGCQGVIGTWLGYKSFISRSIHSEVPSRLLCIDPIIAPMPEEVC
ncbi:hypothetical protein AXW83_16935 [Bosea sp. PAMC 26642]|nr:hypothetical protein AXW83_16935 [Bosea sp. PAMC 26642]